MISHDTLVYKSLRWAYQPVKHSIPLLRELSALPRRKKVISERLASAGFKGLQIGSGTIGFPGWMNSDVAGTPGTDFPLDITKPLPFPDACLDAIYGSEVIEHIERRQVVPFLAEAYRVLKPGGVLRLTTPDLRSVCQIYLGVHERTCLQDQATTWLEAEFSPDYWANAMVRFWGHQWVWDFDALSGKMRSVGFVRVERAEPQVTKSGMPQLENLETRYGVPAPPHCWELSMILEATK
jgi:predicted SAM-dependent methyltransferase